MHAGHLSRRHLITCSKSMKLQLLCLAYSHMRTVRAGHGRHPAHGALLSPRTA